MLQLLFKSQCRKSILQTLMLYALCVYGKMRYSLVSLIDAGLQESVQQALHAPEPHPGKHVANPGLGPDCAITCLNSTAFV